MFEGLRGRQSGEAAAGIRRAVVAVMGLCLVPMLAGCIFNERSLLAIEIPDRYKTAHNLAPTPPPALDWWRGFRSRELTGLIEEAQTANFDIAAAVARIIQADAQSKIAGVALLPSAQFDASVTRSRPAGGPDRTTYRTALTASYEIDFWGKNRAASRAAQENAISVRFDRDVVAVSAVVSVATAYFLVLASQDSLRIARQNVDSATSVLTLIRQRQEAGTASSLEVAQQETLVASQRAQVPLLDQTLRQNIATLALLIGRPPEFVRVRGGSLYSLGIPRVSPGLPSELLYQRPDIRSAEAQLAATDASVESRARRVLPDHPADRPGRLHQHRAAGPVPAGVGVLFARRRADSADLRRLPPGGPVGAGAGTSARGPQPLPQGGGVGLHRRREGADRGPGFR